jgi:hypothetical protein
MTWPGKKGRSRLAEEGILVPATQMQMDRIPKARNPLEQSSSRVSVSMNVGGWRRESKRELDRGENKVNDGQRAGNK